MDMKKNSIDFAEEVLGYVKDLFKPKLKRRRK